MGKTDDKSVVLHSILDNELLVCLKDSDGNRRIGKSTAIAKLMKENSHTERKKIRIVSPNRFMEEYYKDILLNLLSCDEEETKDIFSLVEFHYMREGKLLPIMFIGDVSYNDKVYIDDINEKDIEGLKDAFPKDSLIGWYH